MPTPAQPSVPFDSTVLLDVASSTRPSKGAQLAVAVAFGIMMFILCSPVSGPLPALGIAVSAIVGGILWWRYLRRNGVRGNDYSPLKTDAEAARTPFSWKEEGRLIVVLAIFFGAAQFAPLFSDHIGLAYAGVVALLTVGLTYWIITFDAWRPAHYTIPEKLDQGIRVEKPAEWLQAFLYCRRCVPGGLQILSDTLKRDLAHYGWTASDVDTALNKLVKQGNAVKIRELRSTDGTQNWLTLTEEGSREFQKRYRAG